MGFGTFLPILPIIDRDVVWNNISSQKGSRTMTSNEVGNTMLLTFKTE